MTFSRRKRKVKGGKGKVKSGGRGNQKGKDQATPKNQNKAPQNGCAIASATKLPLSEDDQSEQPKQSSGPDIGPLSTNEKEEKAEEEPKESDKGLTLSLSLCSILANSKRKLSLLIICYMSAYKMKHNVSLQ